MISMLDWTLKSSAILAIALLSVAVLRRQSAAMRHWILSSAFLCVAILPLVRWVTPRWTPGIRVLQIPTLTDAARAEFPQTSPRGTESTQSIASPREPLEPQETGQTLPDSGRWCCPAGMGRMAIQTFA